MRGPNYVEHLNSDQRDVLQDILQNDKEHKTIMTEPSMTFVICEQIANFVCVNTVNKKLYVFSKKIDKLEQLILSLSKSVSEVLNQNELGKSDVCVHVYNSQDNVQAWDDTFELDCSSLDLSVSVEGSLDVGFVAADSFSSTSVEGHCSREQDVGLVGGSDQDLEIVCIGRSRVVESGRAAGIVGSGLYGVDSGRAAGILGGGQSGVVDSGRAAGIVGGFQSGVVDSCRAAGILCGGQSSVVDSGRAAGIVGGGQSGVVDSGRAAGILGGFQSGVVDSGRAAGIVGGFQSGVVDSGRAAGIVGGAQSSVVNSGRVAEIVGGGQSSVDSGRAAGIVGGSQTGVDSGRAAGIVCGSQSGIDSGRAAGIVGGLYGVDSGSVAGIVGGFQSGVGYVQLIVVGQQE
ncbi:circumsporozoite protein-like [Dreissena polymorpha]|uniref:Uncharacterized protein n=1 Tax=Dreissena polymorpha TaxID=45954 RepID=A0A9D4DJ08_DREPO|nr:circumsporozoite protein-like [Dreissena polymorpha]KAH3749270.1 hypothetical protein DPMN_183764 [Dreissena polymorpha]